MTTTRPDWTGAVCRSYDPDMWFSSDDDDVAMAVLLCGLCPVQDTCREWALETRQEAGVWGAMTEHERRTLLRSRQRRAAPSSWCIEPGCDRYARTLGMCQSHAKQTAAVAS